MLLFLIVAYLPLCITLQGNLKSIEYLGNIYVIFRILESYLCLVKFNSCLMEEFIEHPNLKILVQNSSVKVLKVKFPKLVITQIPLVKQLYLNSTNKSNSEGQNNEVRSSSVMEFNQRSHKQSYLS